MPLWSAHPAQAWWYGESSNPAVTLSERQYKVLRMFPQFMHESDVIQTFSKIISDEATSRVGDLMSEILRNQKPSMARSQFIGLMEAQFGIPVDNTLTTDVRRGRVLSKTLRRHRTRISDIATIVRQFTIGEKTYTAVPINDSKNIQVRDVSGFSVGERIFVGSLPREIISIDRSTQTLVVNTKATVDSYTLVADTEVVVTHNPPSYQFEIFLQAGSYENLEGIILAVKEARPAHLGFRIWETPLVTYNQIGYSYNGNNQFEDYDDSGRPYDTDGTYNVAYTGDLLYDGTGQLYP